jgi:hypothetical protein
MADPANPANPETKTADGKTAEAPKFITAEEVAKIVNDALTAREKRAEAKAAKDAEAKAVAAREAAENDDTPKVTRTGDATADAIAELKAQNERLDAKLKREAAERKAEAKAREQEKENALRAEETLKVTEILKGVSVPEARIKGVLAILKVENRIARDASGQIIYKIDEDESVPLAEGISRWLASDDGKQYLPSRGAGGAGIRPGNVRPGGNTPADRKAAAIAAARSALPGLARRFG